MTPLTPQEEELVAAFDEKIWSRTATTSAIEERELLISFLLSAVRTAEERGRGEERKRIANELPTTTGGHWPKDVFGEPWKGWQNDIDALAKTKGQRIDNVSAHLGRWAYSIAISDIRDLLSSLSTTDKKE